MGLLRNKEVRKSGNTQKIRIKNKTINAEVYQIPLDLLYYNDKNDRIATYISQYNDENGVLDISDRDKYNEIMHKFIKQSNESAINKTKANIKKFGQQRPGIVLNDGRIIDGNRRFTCLREILKEGQDNYYEAIILDDEQGFQDKDIKRLELNYQHGEDAKVDYDPVDELVGIYKAIEETKLFTVQEYADETHQKPSTIRTSLETAKLMVEFLEKFTGGEKFYIARDLKIDGPLREINRILKKYSDDDPRKNKLKLSLFALLISTNEGDKTRFIRDFGKTFNDGDKKSNEEMLKEMEPVVKEVYNIARKTSSEKGGPLTASKLVGTVKREAKETIADNNNYVETEIFNSRIDRARQVPRDQINKARNSIKSISGDLVYGLSKSELESLKSEIVKLEKDVMKLKEIIDHA